MLVALLQDSERYVQILISTRRITGHDYEVLASIVMTRVNTAQCKQAFAGTLDVRLLK